MALDALSHRCEKSECERRQKSGNERPAENSAHSDNADEGGGTKRAQDSPGRIHGALESEGAAGLSGRDGIREQGVARRAAAAAGGPSERTHDEDRGPALREGERKS